MLFADIATPGTGNPFADWVINICVAAVVFMFMLLLKHHNEGTKKMDKERAEMTRLWKEEIDQTRQLVEKQITVTVFNTEAIKDSTASRIRSNEQMDRLLDVLVNRMFSK